MPLLPSVVALLLVAVLAASPGHAAPPVPPQCVYTGLLFQIECSGELRNASLALTGNVTTDPSEIRVSMQQLRDYLAKAPAPSMACCESMSSFNNVYCLCAPAMIDEFREFVDMNQLTEVALFLERRCPELHRPFTLYMEPNCPQRPVWKPSPAEAASRAAENVTIIPIEERTVAFVNRTAAAGANATAAAAVANLTVHGASGQR